ncbi:hypothetical protein SDRG_11029 [Saprolegnia diclina VS20]|uniref:RRM domain-containing protein n=1 Tax=Saprolegnia diclina (strain VS20) TaxID=1156394 RepID=T0QD15_SAPDV|nr:hypothetical protein SDRG_11029 [Saprolegnia diclina VS20]EQC31430.1 hypothetical protein SDRG_11029 [Saprolegnia diclina VS20]|eukprot:XP_008615271.1 hypothetical protein SDRG_11029 [Saprolegnia diclina VS20]
MGRRSFSRSPSRGRGRGGRGLRRSFSRDRGPRGRGRSYSRSASRSRSDSRSSRSSYSSRSSSGSRSRSRGRKSRSRSNASKGRKSRSPSPDDGASLHVANLTRNVNPDHLSEIFGKFGVIQNVNLETDKVSRLSKGFAYIQFAKRAEAETAQLHMHEGQIDGNKVQSVAFAESQVERSPAPAVPFSPEIASEQSPRELALPSTEPLSAEWRSPGSIALSQTKPAPRKSPIPERPPPAVAVRAPWPPPISVSLAVAAAPP